MKMIYLVFALLLCSGTLEATPKPSAPKPKAAASAPWKLDKPVLFLAGVQLGAELSDGVSTRSMIDRGWYEHNGFSRSLIGEHPSWGRMVPIGAAELVGTAYVAQWMKHTRWGKHIWWMPQVGLAVLHARAAYHNSTLGNNPEKGSCPPGKVCVKHF